MKKFIRPAMLVVPLITGMFFPEVSRLAYPPFNFIRWILCVIIFINVLQIRFADLRPRKEHAVLLAANILLGIVPFYLLKFLCPGSEVPAQAAFFAGIAPTAAAAAVIVSLLECHVGFAVTAFILSNVGISAALVLLLPLVTGNFSASFFLQVFWSLTTVIGIPLLCAKIISRIFPKITLYMGKLKLFSLALWSLSLFIMAAIARTYFNSHTNSPLKTILTMVIISLVICAANFGCGYLINRKFRRESSQVLGQKNTTFTLYLALQYASEMAALATIFYVIFHNLWNSIQLFAFSGKRKPGSADIDPPADLER